MALKSQKQLEKWIPHNYQLTALSHILMNRRLALFLDPGLGKTSILLAAMKILIALGKVKGVLIIAPLRVTYSVWPSEIEKWLNFHKLKYTIIHDEGKATIWDKNIDVFVTNPESIKWIHDELHKGLTAGKKPPFNTLILDESTKFKSHDSKRFEYLCNMLPLFIRRHIATGTPCARSLMDLWSQFYILDDGKTLGNNFVKFRNEFFETNDWNKYDYQLKDFSEIVIQQRIAPMVVEMSAKDYLKMPELIENHIDVGLSPKALNQYKQMEKDYFLELDGLEASADQAAQVVMKCQQIANGRVYEDIPPDLTEAEEKAFRKTRKVIHVHDHKLDALEELVHELNGKPLLVAYHFKHDLAAIEKRFGKLPNIGSGVSPKQTEILKNKWNNGEIQILLANPKSMSHGLNLQESGNDVAWFSLTWSLEDYQQFIARIWRQGVKGAYVRVHLLFAKGTVDEMILRRSREKAAVQQDLRTAVRDYRKGII